MKHALAIATLLAPSAIAQSVATVGADRDNTLYEDVVGAVSNGAGTNMFVGKTGAQRITRGIVHFDVASVVPAGSVILDARFEADIAFAAINAAPGAIHSLHRVLADWGEGSTFASAGAGGQGAGGPATVGSATYLHTFFPSDFWQSAGGDYVLTASASQTTDLFGVVAMEGPGLVADLQRWIDQPSENFGWILRADDETTGARVYVTREGGGVNSGPRLTLTFERPVGTSVCSPATPNSTGLAGRMRATGSDIVADARLTLRADRLPPSTFGIFVVSRDFGVTPNAGGSFGDLCLAGSIGRYQSAIQNTGPDGAFDLSIDLAAIPTPSSVGPILAGETLYFQAWFRDLVQGVAGSNYTDAVLVDFR